MRYLTILMVAILSACATDSQKKIKSSAVTPLHDINLMSVPIPEILALARQAPYGVPSDATCLGLRAQITALDEELGPDIDAPANDAKPSLVQRGEAAVLNALQKSAESVVPLRSWVRKLTGAERRSKLVASSIAAATLRRAFLKGMVKAKDCDAPSSAAPDTPELIKNQ